MAEFDSKKQEATMRDFLNVVFRWKYLIIAIFGFTTFFIVFMKVSKPLTYSASSRILVERGERPNVFVAAPRYQGWAEEMSSQLEVILSEAVFVEAREVFADSLAANGLEGTRYFNAGAVRADVVGESNVIVIGYSGLDPIECEYGCAAVTNAYIAYYQRRTAPPAVTDFFESQIDEALTEVNEWRRRKSDFLKGEEYVGIREAGNHLMYQLSHLEVALFDAKSEVSGQELRVRKLEELTLLSTKQLEARLSTATAEGPIQSRILTDIRFALQETKVEKQELLTKYTEKHPSVISVDNQMADLRGQLKQEIINAHDAAKSQYDALFAKQRSLETDIARVESQIAGVPEKQKELSRFESKITAYEQKYQLLLQRQNEAEIAVASSNEFEVTVLTPPGKAWPRRTSDVVRLAVGPFLSIIVALGLAFFFESMDHSLKNPAEVEQYIGSRVLATVTEMSEKK
jgi:succinoglycan biosynthesis transport protein ExoP